MVTSNVILILAARIGVGMTIGLAASFFVVLPLGYFLHSRFTFTSAYGGPVFLRYATTMAANLPLSTCMLWIFYKFLCWPMAVAAPAMSAGMLIGNFFASRWAISRDKRFVEGSWRS